MEKLGQEPAFSYLKQTGKNAFTFESGMNKRFYAACAALQGMLADDAYRHRGHELIITEAYQLADELLRQENEN